MQPNIPMRRISEIQKQRRENNVEIQVLNPNKLYCF